MLGKNINIHIHDGGQLNLAKDNGRINAVQNAMNAKCQIEKPRIKIIQNLWTDYPKFKLMNESDVVLQDFDLPTYLMLIPSKILFRDKNTQQVFSLLVLSPISYEVIIEQENTGNTKGDISISKLPICFKAKMGERDVIRGGIVEETEELEIRIDTYPFLVIVSDVIFSCFQNKCREIIISTPMGNWNIDETYYENLLEYIRDHARYEVKVENTNENIYQRTNNVVKKMWHNIKEHQTFFCAKEGGYGNVLKLINQIITPNDILS